MEVQIHKVKSHTHQSKKLPGLRARRAAFEVLLRLEQGAFADVLLGHVLPGFEVRDRRLITSLVLGTTAWRARLDYEIDRLLSSPSKPLNQSVRVLLRMGIYQLRFLTRTASYAVVSSAVELAKIYPEARPAAGLVNAVLRRASREIVALPDPEKDRIEYLSIAYSHPRWMVERLIEWFGEKKAIEIMAADNTPAPNAIRLNLTKGSRDDVVNRLRAEGLEVSGKGVFPETAFIVAAEDKVAVERGVHRSGLFLYQSEVSQIVARLVAPTQGALVLDCAAAPGAKATHLAELVGKVGRVVALDKNLSGLYKVKQIASQLGHNNVLAVQADLTKGVPFRPQSFSFVLLDAPCTGLGTLRSHPEIRWRLKPEDIPRMALLQLTMLKTASELVKPEGVLVYAVCSFAPEEGIEVVRRFLRENADFQPCTEEVGIKKEYLADAGDGYVCLSLLPSVNGPDGFFAVRLKRSSKKQ